MSARMIRRNHWWLYEFLSAFTLIALIGIFENRVVAAVTESPYSRGKHRRGAVTAGTHEPQTNTATQITQTQPSNKQGFYSFQLLSPGRYDIAVLKPGFKVYRQKGLVLHVSAAL